MNSPDDSVISCFVEIGLRCLDNLNEKTRNFFFAPDKKKIDSDNFTPYLKENKPKISTQNRKVICKRCDKKSYFMHCWMLKSFLGHRMIVDKVHEVISLGQTILF